MKLNSITVSADRSGAGKTTFTCALLSILKKRGHKVCSYKCGPDYIDPMYHRRIIGIPSGNIDSYFVETNVIKRMMSEKMVETASDICVIEGAMGYYDGLGGVSTEASCYDISVRLCSPVLLIVNASAVSVSLAAAVKGMLEFKTDNKISGVILNRVSSNFYPRLKQVVESECGVKVFGYLPPGMPSIPSRHLGLMAPEDIAGFEKWVELVSEQVEATVDIDAVIEMAGGCELEPDYDCVGGTPEEEGLGSNEKDYSKLCTIAVARDDAFSFYYEENLNMLRRIGARLVYFSPMEDEKLPEASGLILGGGYPEEYAKKLSGNRKMREDILCKIKKGMPFLAECGGFLYLQKELVGTDGNSYEMVGFFGECGENSGGLMRFGYLEAKMKEECILGPKGTLIRGHEFHHWDVSDPGSDVLAHKPYADDYSCMKCTKDYAAGFPHFYYESNPDAVVHFLERCNEYGCK